MNNKNKYVDVFMPNHHRARSSGNVHEHVIKAEEKIGRLLKKEEVVHHEDENKANNTSDNLYVFKDLANHSRYHKTGLKSFNGVNWESNPELGSKNNPYVKKCKHCAKEFKTTFKDSIYCSLACRSKVTRKCVRPGKEKLYELLKDNNFTVVGKMFDVSDNTIRKWCTSYGIPTKSSYYRSL